MTLACAPRRGLLLTMKLPICSEKGRSHLVLAALVLAGTVSCTSPHLDTATSDAFHKINVLRYQCEQYAVILSAEMDHSKPGYRELQQAYISVYASANAFLDRVALDIQSGAPADPERYSMLAANVQASAESFLSLAMAQLEQQGGQPVTPGSRGLFAAAVVTDLLGAGMKLHDYWRGVNDRRRSELKAQLEKFQWRSLDQLERPGAGPRASKAGGPDHAPAPAPAEPAHTNRARPF
jgi:hypothetical protein